MYINPIRIETKKIKYVPVNKIRTDLLRIMPPSHRTVCLWLSCMLFLFLHKGYEKDYNFCTKKRTPSGRFGVVHSVDMIKTEHELH